MIQKLSNCKSFHVLRYDCGRRSTKPLPLMILVSFLTLISATIALAEPSPPGAFFWATQPDGTKLQLFPVGDEYTGHTLAKNGYTVRKGSDGWYYYATLNADGELQPSKTKVRSLEQISDKDRSFLNSIEPDLTTLRIPHPPQFPTANLSKDRYRTQARGMVVPPPDKCIILLIKFPDLNPTYSTLRYDSLFNFDGFENSGSLNQYFREVSYGAFGVEGTTNAVWYTAANPHSYYAFSNGITRSQELAAEAIDAAIAAGVDFSPYDADGNGEVDGVFIVFAGEGRALAGEDFPQTHAQDFSRTAGTVSITSYVLINEQILDTYNGNSNAKEPQHIGTYAHEYLHTKGLPDLYTVTYGVQGLRMEEVMAHGLWGGVDTLNPSFSGRGTQPSHPSAWSKIELGWTHPINVTGDLSSVPLLPRDNADACYRLWRTGASGNEYFLIEYRRACGFDGWVDGCGVLIYHVNDIYKSSGNLYNQHVDLEEADGYWGSIVGPFPKRLAFDTWRLGDTFNYQSTARNSLDVSGAETGVQISVASDCGPELLTECSSSATSILVSLSIDVGTDTDGDGMIDVLDNCPLVFNPAQADVDGDGFGDACDSCDNRQDSDGDGVADNCDLCPGYDDFQDADTMFIGGGPAFFVNGDAIPDSCDNCPQYWNPSQTDIDGDGWGEADATTVGTPNPQKGCDNCPGIYNPDQLDSDGNGIGDACEPVPCCNLAGDADNSGTVNIVDVTFIINRIFSGGPPPPCCEEGDANGDGAFNIADAIYIQARIFSGGPAAVCGPPGMTCGS